MKEKIKEFLKEQNLYPGQVYKICPDKFLEEFIKFLEKK